MRLSAAAAIARETGSDRIELFDGVHLMCHNEGPIREPVRSRTRTDGQANNPAISPKLAGLRKRTP